MVFSPVEARPSDKDLIFKNLKHEIECMMLNKIFLQARHSSGCLNGNANPLSMAAISIIPPLFDLGIASWTVTFVESAILTLRISVFASSFMFSNEDFDNEFRFGDLLF